VEVASLHPWKPSIYDRDYRGYYWSCATNDDLGVRHVNTYSSESPDWADSQLAEAKAHVRSCIAKMIKEGPSA